MITWISRAKQLPEQWSWVICYDNRLGQVELLKWTGSRWINNHGDVYDGITHWQPQPEAPDDKEAAAILKKLPKLPEGEGIWNRPVSSVLRFLAAKHGIPDLEDRLDKLILREFSK